MEADARVHLRTATTVEDECLRVVLEVRCGRADGPHRPSHTHVLLDASGSMYYSALPEAELLRFTELARARGELAQVVSDGRPMWTVSGHTKEEMARANRTPMQWVARALGHYARAMPRESDLSLLAFATECRPLLASERAEGALDATLTGLVAGAWAAELGDGSRPGAALRCCAEAVERATPGVRPRALLLSDGGAEDPDEVGPAMARLIAAGVPVSTVGLGRECDMALLGRLASASGGRSHHVPRLEDLHGALLEELAAASRTLSDRMELLLAPEPSLRLVSAVQVRPEARGLPTRQLSGSAVLLSLGPAEQGQERLVVLELAREPGGALDPRASFGSVAIRLGPDSGLRGEAWSELRGEAPEDDLAATAARALREEQFLRFRLAAQTAWSEGRRDEAGQHTEQAAEIAAALGWDDAARQLRWEAETIRGR